MFSIFQLEEEMNGKTVKSVARDQLVFNVSSNVLAAKTEAKVTTAEFLKLVIDKLSTYNPDLKNNMRLMLEKEHQEANNNFYTCSRFYSHTK